MSSTSEIRSEWPVPGFGLDQSVRSVRVILRPLYVSCVLAVLFLTPRAFADAALTSALPTFEGYSTVGTKTYFALTIRRDNQLIRQAWLNIGESIGSFRVHRFVAKDEVLFVTDAGGHSHELRLIGAYTVNDASAQDAKTRSAAAKERGLKEIEAYRLKGIELFGPANVIVDLDGSLLPASRRANYASHRASSEARGEVFTPVCVDGKWHNVFTPRSPPPNSKSPEARSLNDSDLDREDAEELRQRWIIAKAEFGARLLASPPGTAHAKTAPKKAPK